MSRQTFQHLTRNGFDQIPYGCDPQYDPLHEEPRFMAIMRRYHDVATRRGEE